jgi:hypothetical protein
MWAVLMPRPAEDVAVVWHETAGRHADPSVVVAHAVDGDKTLCGEPARVVPWRDTGRGKRCEKCIAALTDAPVTYQEIQSAVPGLTYRTLNHWTVRGYLQAANPGCGSGRRQTWPAGEVEVAQLMHVLVTAGLSPRGAERAARNRGVLSDGVRVVVALDGLALPGVDPDDPTGKDPEG